jgi:hypothetical protein
MRRAMLAAVLLLVVPAVNWAQVPDDVGAADVGAAQRPAPPPASVGFYPSKYIGRGDAFNCADFVSQADAQAVLRADSSSAVLGMGVGQVVSGIDRPEVFAIEHSRELGVVDERRSERRCWGFA